MCCRWRCATRSWWPGNARRSTICRMGASCRPLGSEWKTLNLDTKTRGRKTDEGLDVIRRLWSEDKVDFEGVHYHLSGASLSPKPVQPDLPMWIGGSSDAAIRRTARLGTGWQAGPETPEQARIVVAAIRAAAIEAGRTIDDDHYGAGIPFRFGAADDPALAPLFEAYKKRTGRDPKDYFAIGDGAAIADRIGAYVDAGVSKFILRPAARGDDEIMAQTRRLIEEVLRRVALAKAGEAAAGGAGGGMRQTGGEAAGG